MQPDAIEEQHFEPLDFRVKGDKVLVRVHATGRGAGSGIEVDFVACVVYTLDDHGLVKEGSALPPPSGSRPRSRGPFGVGMSQENVEIVRRNYEVVNSIDRTGPEFIDPEEVAPDLWAKLAPDFEFHERSELPDAKVYRGREEAKRVCALTPEVFAELRWEPLEFIDLGHAVVVVTRVAATGRGSEVSTKMDETDVFWFREGQIVRLQGFATKEQALEAARPSEYGTQLDLTWPTSITRRSWVPTPIVRSASRTSTSNRSLRPSTTSRSVERT